MLVAFKTSWRKIIFLSFRLFSNECGQNRAEKCHSTSKKLSCLSYFELIWIHLLFLFTYVYLLCMLLVLCQLSLCASLNWTCLVVCAMRLVPSVVRFSLSLLVPNKIKSGLSQKMHSLAMWSSFNVSLSTFIILFVVWRLEHMRNKTMSENLCVHV